MRWTLMSTLCPLGLVLVLADFRAESAGAESRQNRRNTGRALSWRAGAWDSTIYNLVEHPRTVAIRIEVIDAETRIPVKGARVSLAGNYVEERIGTSGDEVGIPREPQEREFRLSATTGKDGVTVFALGWQKEYPWRSYSGGHPPRDYEKGKSGSYTVKRAWTRAVDDVEKAQKIEIRHSRYRYVEGKLGFGRFLDVGHEKRRATQRPAVFDRFEKAWHAEMRLQDVKFCVLELGKTFADFGNNRSVRPEFFAKIRKKDYGKVYTRPLNWFSKGDHPQSLCGPYLIYLIEIRLKGRSHPLGTKRSGTDEKRKPGRGLPARKDGPVEVTTAEGIESWREAVQTIKNSLSSDMVVFGADRRGRATVLYWQLKSKRYMECELTLSSGMDITVSRSGATITLSCRDKDTAKEAVRITPRNEKQQLLDDDHPMSITIRAKSIRHADDVARALRFLVKE